jgi:hypothetical protein
MKFMLLPCSLVLLSLVFPASAAEWRVDLYGLEEIRSGYAIIDGARADHSTLSLA